MRKSPKKPTGQRQIVQQSKKIVNQLIRDHEQNELRVAAANHEPNRNARRSYFEDNGTDSFALCRSMCCCILGLTLLAIGLIVYLVITQWSRDGLYLVLLAHHRYELPIKINPLEIVIESYGSEMFSSEQIERIKLVILGQLYQK